MRKNLSIYIHIPFCVKKCVYCDFLSFGADDPQINRSGALTITNSRIEGNTTTLTDYKAVHTMEAGVTVKGGSVALSGEVCVSDNIVSVPFPNLEKPVLMSTSGIFLSKGKTLDISSMSGNSRCAVSLEEGHNGVFATGTEAHL